MTLIYRGQKYVQNKEAAKKQHNELTYRGKTYTISRQYWIDEWNGTDSLRFDFTYINSSGTEYLDHYYLELIDGTFTFSDTPTNESLLGSSDLNDASKFSINSSTGALSFSSAPDYESPGDSDTSNDYIAVVKATNSAGTIDSQTVTVSVNDLISITGPSGCLLYTSPSPRDVEESRMPSSA